MVLYSSSHRQLFIFVFWTVAYIQITCPHNQTLVRIRGRERRLGAAVAPNNGRIEMRIGSQVHFITISRTSRASSQRPSQQMFPKLKNWSQKKWFIIRCIINIQVRATMQWPPWIHSWENLIMLRADSWVPSPRTFNLDYQIVDQSMRTRRLRILQQRATNQN